MKLALIALLLTTSANAAPIAQAELKTPDGKKVGTATFIETKNGVQLSVRAKGLAPGSHGIHFHQTGKCEGPDFKSAGEHLSGPAAQGHGLHEKGPHAGDLPNLVVGEDGTAVSEMNTPRVTLKTGPRSLLKEGGTSIVIHEKADDQRTDPSGKSGDRVACGVITSKGSG